MKNFRPEHDKQFSTYGWRILINPSEDYRKVKEGNLVFTGYSKLRGTIEEPEKGRLLMSCVHRLRDNGYIKKADGIIIYKGTPFVNESLPWSQALISVIKKNGNFELSYQSQLLTTNQISYVTNIIFEETRKLIVVKKFEIKEEILKLKIVL